MITSAKAKTLSLFALLSFVLPAAVRAGAAPDRDVVVRPGCAETLIKKNQLTGTFPSASVGSYTRPQLGELLEVADAFIYQPSDDFWTAGTDSFTYTLELPLSQEGLLTGTVILNAGLHAQGSGVEGFEGGWGHGWVEVDPGGTLSVQQHAAISGAWGLRVGSALIGSDAYLRKVFHIYPGGGDTGSGTQSTIRIPASPGQGLLNGGMSKLFSMGDPDSMGIYLWLRTVGSSQELGLEAGGSSFWRPVSPGIHQVRLVSWLPGENGDCSAGAALWVDGALHTLTTIHQALGGLNDEVRIGKMGQAATYLGSVDFDDVVFQSFRDQWQSRQPLVIDGFEGAAPVDGWTEAPATALLTPEAALTGEQGLEVVLGSGLSPRGTLLVHQLETPASRLGGRFRVNPTVLSLARNGGILLLGVYDETRAPLLSLTLMVENGALKLEAKALVQEGPPRKALVSLGSEPKSQLTFDWQAASTVDSAATGSLRIWRGDQMIIELTGIDNGGQTASELRFGAKATTPPMEGVVYLDQFESWTW